MEERKWNTLIEEREFIVEWMAGGIEWSVVKGQRSKVIVLKGGRERSSVLGSARPRG